MREQKQRESERRKEEAATIKERKRREEAVAKAQAAIEKAKAEHDERANGGQNAKPTLSRVEHIVRRAWEIEADVDEG